MSCWLRAVELIRSRLDNMVLAILQARYSSSRLPGKILKDIVGRPMVFLEMERLKRAKNIDKLVLATSVEQSDNPVEEACRKYGVECYRGNLDDVLDRYYSCAEAYKPEHVVRVTGDCPLIDPAVVDMVIKKHLAEGNDYTCNINPPTFPDGLDVEIMKYSVLREAWQEAKLPSEREHVTPFIRNHPERYKLASMENDKDLSALRWTVDEPADFDFVCLIYEKLYKTKFDFSMNDVLHLLKKEPALLQINSGFERNEGMKKSLLADKEFLAKEEK